MNPELELLDPVRIVRIGQETIEVRELRWVDALAFLDKLAGSIGLVLGTQGINPDGTLRLNADRLKEAVLSSGELASLLLAKATSLPQERLEQLPASHALALLEAAVQVNFREELLGKCRAVANALRGVLQVSPQPSTPTSP